jgi:hypothetical protein
VSAKVTYVAPARFALDCLHVPGTGSTVGELAGDVPLTRCGTPMAGDELWQPVERKDGDRVCTACDGLEAAPDEDALW